MGGILSECPSPSMTRRAQAWEAAASSNLKERIHNLALGVVPALSATRSSAWRAAQDVRHRAVRRLQTPGSVGIIARSARRC